MPSEQVSAMSKHATNMDNEQASAKSEPVRCFCVLNRNDGPVSMKEDGRKEGCPGNTAWGNPMQPHTSPKAMKQVDCYEDLSSDTAW